MGPAWAGENGSYAHLPKAHQQTGLHLEVEVQLVGQW